MAEPEGTQKKSDLLTSRQELADFLGVSVWTIERWLARCAWPGGKLNGRFRCTRVQALAWLEELKQSQAKVHPESPSRLRPPDAPGLAAIKGR